MVHAVQSSALFSYHSRIIKADGVCDYNEDSADPHAPQAVSLYRALLISAFVLAEILRVQPLLSCMFGLNPDSRF